MDHLLHLCPHTSSGVLSAKELAIARRWLSTQLPCLEGRNELHNQPADVFINNITFERTQADVDTERIGYDRAVVFTWHRKAGKCEEVEMWRELTVQGQQREAGTMQDRESLSTQDFDQERSNNFFISTHI